MIFHIIIISYAIIDFFLFYGLTVARCPFPAIAEGCPGLQGLHQTVHHAGFISLCKRANYTGNGHYTVTGSLATDRRGRKKKKNTKKHDDKRERVFKRTYRSANARTRLLPAVIPIVAGESGAPQVHGWPLRSEPHGGHESECDITISLYCTTVWVLSLTARSFFRADCEERKEKALRDGPIQAEEPQDESIHWCSSTDISFLPSLSLWLTQGS